MSWNLFGLLVLATLAYYEVDSCGGDATTSEDTYELCDFVQGLWWGWDWSWGRFWIWSWVWDWIRDWVWDVVAWVNVSIR